MNAAKRSQSVAIIGAGFGGLAMALELKQQGFDDFTIFEKSAHLGGTWWDNRYPGAAVDTPSLVYQFGDKPRKWSRSHVKGPEVLAYMTDLSAEHGLDTKLHCDTEIVEVNWDDRRHCYTLIDTTGTAREFDAVFCAVGLLNVPRVPEIPGLDEFTGPVVHTARWPDDVDLSDKTVAVIGTGSSAAQVVPALADEGIRVVVYQREPGWILPKGDHDLTPKEERRLNHPLTWRYERIKALIKREILFHHGAMYRTGTKTNQEFEGIARAFIDRVFKDRPDLAEMVTPNYAFGGKRQIIDSDFYPSLLLDNVELVPHSVVAVDGDVIVDASGGRHQVDAIITATGFHAHSFLRNLEVMGRGGISIHEKWNGEPSAFLGICVPDFPNFFLAYGPNTNGGGVHITGSVFQARYAVAALKTMRKEGYTSVEVSQTAADRFNRWLSKRLDETVWGENNNYFKTESGKVVTQWPEGALFYCAMTWLFRRSVWQLGRATDNGDASVVAEQLPEREVARV